MTPFGNKVNEKRTKFPLFDRNPYSGYLFSRKGETMMSLGIEVKKGRIDRRWQQEDLAQAAGISRKYLSQIENDRVDPRFSIVQRLAQALGVSLDTLGRQEQTPPPAPPSKRPRPRKATPVG
jgi:DNA-binding XRE family transcriptional regulator